MATRINRISAVPYAMMRIVTGLLFLCNGTEKLFNFPRAYEHDSGAFILWSTGIIELAGGLLVAIGLSTRPAAFLCFALMAVTYWKDYGTGDIFPSVNGGELPVLYCFVFLFIWAHGPGIWSIGAVRARKSR
jgi:putative oxidoreductase